MNEIRFFFISPIGSRQYGDNQCRFLASYSDANTPETTYFDFGVKKIEIHLKTKKTGILTNFNEVGILTLLYTLKAITNSLKSIRLSLFRSNTRNIFSENSFASPIGYMLLRGKWNNLLSPISIMPGSDGRQESLSRRDFH